MPDQGQWACVPFPWGIHPASRGTSGGWICGLGLPGPLPCQGRWAPAAPTHRVQAPAALSQACQIDHLILFSLQKFPELKFKYVEEEQPEEFFIPYVWSLVYNSAVGLYWNPQDIQLFTMDSD